MKRILIFTLCFVSWASVARSEICTDFDDNLNIIEYECGTSLQAAIQAKKAQEANKQAIAEEKEKQAKIAAEKAEQQKKEAEQARIEAEKAAQHKALEERIRREVQAAEEQKQKEEEERIQREKREAEEQKRKAEEQKRKEEERAKREKQEKEELARIKASCKTELCKYWAQNQNQWFVGLGVGLFWTNANEYTSWRYDYFPTLNSKSSYIGEGYTLQAPVKSIQFGGLHHLGSYDSNWSLLWRLGFKNFELKDTYKPSKFDSNYNERNHTVKLKGNAFAGDIGADYKLSKYFDIYGGAGLTYINMDVKKSLHASHNTNLGAHINEEGQAEMNTLTVQLFTGLDVSVTDWLRIYFEPSIVLMPSTVDYTDASIGVKVMF